MEGLAELAEEAAKPERNLTGMVIGVMLGMMLFMAVIVAQNWAKVGKIDSNEENIRALSALVTTVSIQVSKLAEHSKATDSTLQRHEDELKRLRDK